MPSFKIFYWVEILSKKILILNLCPVNIVVDNDGPWSQKDWEPLVKPIEYDIFDFE